ncbi:MAG: transcription repressor NadR [Defluviitaleaceae bacterium]|nr:transcription repressor NadR [Defluviitaleaceae bacterium]
MNAKLRREKILEIITKSQDAVTASKLASILNVSRQVIVGDVALIRAGGHSVIATAKGYIIPQAAPALGFCGTIACKHSASDTRAELMLITSLGAVVVDVTIEHEFYGEITGQLNLKTPEDVEAFIAASSGNPKLLSELTGGIHLHTIYCRDKVHFEQIKVALEGAGFLL